MSKTLGPRLKERPELFLKDNSVRPGILVLGNVIIAEIYIVRPLLQEGWGGGWDLLTEIKFKKKRNY